MNKNEATDLTNTIYTADLILRIHGLETLLISKGVCTREELDISAKVASKEILKTLLQKAGVQGDLDKIIDDIQNTAFANRDFN